MRDPYLYEDVDVLRNLLNIKEEKLLETACIFARLIAYIWQIHPFRGGNTHSVITLATQFAYAHGFGMDKQLLKNPQYMFMMLLLSLLTVNITNIIIYQTYSRILYLMDKFIFI